MTVVLWKTRRSRLSTLIDQPGGVSAGVALDQARANLAALREEGLALVGERIAMLAALPVPVSAQQTADGLQQVYAMASAIISAAGPFDRGDLCTAAKGLCDVIDAAQPGAPFDWRIVTVHARALQLICGLPDGAAKERAVILANLAQIVAKKAPEPGQTTG